MSNKVIIFILLILISSMLFSAEKYAVLITGDYADSLRANYDGSWAIANGYDRDRPPMQEFWNDTFLMWEMLVIEKGYSDENVFVLFAGGLDYPNDPGAAPPAWWADRYNPRVLYPDFINPIDGHITDYAATITNVNNVFNGLANGTGELPQLQDDDFLFCWIFDHGCAVGQDAYIHLIDGGMSDYVFADLTDQISCQKKVFWMQQCQSGGFIDNLEGNDTYINTSCHYSTGCNSCDDETLSGDLAIENELIDGHQYTHGEFDFHLYSCTIGCSPAYYTHYPEYTGDPYTNADINVDGIISVDESRIWEATYESENAIPQYSDLGNIGTTTSLEYPNLVSGVLSQSTNLSGIIAITGDLTVTNNSTLTIEKGAIVYLKFRNQIEVQSGSILQVGDNVTFFGETTTISEEIPGNRIEIYGNVSFGTGVQFTVEDDEYWDGLYVYSTSALSLNSPTFGNCNLYSEKTDFIIQFGEFTNSVITHYGKDLEFYDTNLANSYVYANEPAGVQFAYT